MCIFAIPERFTDKSENARDAIFSHAYLNTDFRWTRPTFDTTVNIHRVISSEDKLTLMSLIVYIVRPSPL